MSCKRCGGLMVVDTFSPLLEEACTEIDPIRCLNCGNVEDAIIRANRDISRLPSHVDRYTAGARGPRTIQPCRSLPATQTEGVIAECPRGRAPHPPVGAPSANARTFDSAHSEPHNPMIQTRRRCA
jgi:hypothetical protein